MNRLSFSLFLLLLPARPAHAQRIYWGQADGLWRASLDGSDAHLIAETDTPQQIQIDRTTARIYYSRFFLPIGHIARIGLRDSEQQLLWSSETIGQGFALDPLRQEIYFTANDSSVWRFDIKTLARQRISPNFASDIAIAPAGRTLYWTQTNDVLEQHTLNRRQLDGGDSETLFFNFTLIPLYRRFGHVTLDPFEERLFAVSFLVYYSGYPEERFRPGLDVFDLAAQDFPRQTFYTFDADSPFVLANHEVFDLALDPVHEQLYLLHKPASEAAGFVSRFDLAECLGQTPCEPDVLPIEPIVFAGMSLPLDPCGIDEHPVLSDVASFSNCMTGPSPQSSIPRACYCSDYDEDLHTDLRDVAFLQNLFLGHDP